MDKISFARALRRAQTPGEAALWDCLRDRRLGGVKFRRQVPLGPWIVDFYAPGPRLIIELDGASHDHERALAADDIRASALTSRGNRLLRFAEDDARTHLDGVLTQVRVTLGVPEP